MKLPNWLHRKPRALTIDEFFGGPLPALDFEPDPYLNSLLAKKPLPDLFGAIGREINAKSAAVTKGQYEAELDKPGHAPGEYVPDGTGVKDPWDAAFYERKQSIDVAHTKGYWEGRAEADAQAANPKYSVEVVRTDLDDSDAIDEVLLHDATRCLFHLERLDTDHWWITLSPTGGWNEEESFDIFRVKKCIEVTEQ